MEAVAVVLALVVVFVIYKTLKKSSKSGPGDKPGGGDQNVNR